MNRLFVVSVLGAALLLSAFVAVLYRSGGDDRAGSASAPTAAVPEPVAVKPLPAPSGERVLRIQGVKTGNVSATETAVDFATLDRAATDKLTILEPFVKRKMTFSVVPMGELLQRAGADPAARKLYMHALDDYHVTFTRDELASSGAVLATRANGARIAIKDGGPIRIILPRSGEVADNTDNWVWSVDRMRASR